MLGVVKVAVLVNPYSGRDIRRVSAYAGTVTNWERVRALRMFIQGLSVTPVDEVVFYPDPDGVSEYVIEEFRGRAPMEMFTAQMVVEGTWADTARFTEIAWREGAGAMLVLGGDGTVRAAAKAFRDVKLLPISMGTNNAVPYALDPTHAGIVAGYVAWRGSSRGVYRAKRVVVRYEGGVDLGLVDLAFTTHGFVGARAVLDVGMVEEVYMTMGTPESVGLTSILGYLRPISRREPLASKVVLGRGFRTVALLAPGVVREVGVREVRVLKLPYREGRDVDYTLLSFDGERDLVVRGQRLDILIDDAGPPIIDPHAVLREMVEEGVFTCGLSAGAKRLNTS